MVLVITIVVMLIITTTVISLSTNNLKTKNLSNLYSDIKSLDDKISVFYNQYGALPLKEKFAGNMNFQNVANPNDDIDGYYVIDINKLNGLVLTKKLTWQNDDVYIINNKTHTIYYPKGVALDGEIYYRLPGEYTEIGVPKVDKNGLAIENTTIKPDENNNLQIVIPAGFAPAILNNGKMQSLPGEDGSVNCIMPAREWCNITIEDINKGVVVVDGEGNEFVWIPIIDSNKFKRIAWTSNFRADLSEKAMNDCYWEDKTTSEYTNMVNSVANNKGFYIGRYEACKDTTEKIAQSKRNEKVWGGVSQLNSIQYSLNYNRTLNSHLLYGIEWDSVLNWINQNGVIASNENRKTKVVDLEDLQTNSNTWGNYKAPTGDASTNSGALKNTGTSEYWKTNNIYDLAGNVWEWTQEWYGNEENVARRGGNYVYSGEERPVAMRYPNKNTMTADVIGFRFGFYL